MSLARLIPIGIRSAVGSGIGRFFSYFPTKDRVVGELQLQRCGFDPKVIHDSYAHFGRVLFEALDARSTLSDYKRHFSITEGADLLEEIKKSPAGITLTGHYGHWDLLAGYGIKLGIPIVAIGRFARGKLAQKILEKLRAQYGIEMLWRGGARGLSNIEEAIKSGKMVSALIDQDTKVRTTSVPFFGMEAATPSTLVTFAMKSNTPLFSAFLRRVAPLRYELSIRKITDRTDEKVILQQFHHHLEDLIRKDPSQWVWFHKRWRTQATGERFSTSQYINFLRTSLRMPSSNTSHES